MFKSLVLDQCVVTIREWGFEASLCSSCLGWFPHGITGGSFAVLLRNCYNLSSCAERYLSQNFTSPCPLWFPPLGEGYCSLRLWFYNLTSRLLFDCRLRLLYLNSFFETNLFRLLGDFSAPWCCFTGRTYCLKFISRFSHFSSSFPWINPRGLWFLPGE